MCARWQCDLLLLSSSCCMSCKWYHHGRAQLKLQRRGVHAVMCTLLHSCDCPSCPPACPPLLPGMQAFAALLTSLELSQQDLSAHTALLCSVL